MAGSSSTYTRNKNSREHKGMLWVNVQIIRGASWQIMKVRIMVIAGVESHSVPNTDIEQCAFFKIAPGAIPACLWRDYSYTELYCEMEITW